MIAIDHIVLEAPDVASATAFYCDTLQLDDRVQVRQAEQPTSGFRGYTLGLDVADAESVDRLLTAAVAAGAETIKAGKKQFWGGYSGVIRTPDGAVVKVATSDNNPTDSAAGTVARVVQLLGVTHVGTTKDFYVEAGLPVAKAFGNKYVEFEPAGGAVTLAIYKRSGLAKEFGVDAEGAGAHRMALGSNGVALTDPDGFVWEAAGSGS
jgi:catechol 2,3-dioxygenase-like lactoylglutathione lyase family enzyme